MNDIEKAIKIIKQGGIVIYPTDTAYGIGCRLDNKKAVERLFKIRKRPINMPTPVLFDDVKRIKEYVLPYGKDVEKLMFDYFPGALTLILRCIEEKVPSLVRGGGGTLGVRIPDHETVWQLIKGAHSPILGPSANFHARETPYSFETLDKELIKLVDFVLEGKTKGKGSTSTVVDCTKKPWKIIRQGEIKLDL